MQGGMTAEAVHARMMSTHELGKVGWRKNMAHCHVLAQTAGICRLMSQQWLASKLAGSCTGSGDGCSLDDEKAREAVKVL